MTALPSVREERSHWRDEALSERHRLWGYDCPAVDIDFLLVEFHQGRPAALVEYKTMRPTPPNLAHPTYTALRTLATAINIPFMVVLYDARRWWFRVIPANFPARTAYRQTVLSERDYVSSLYRLRGIVPPAALLARLNTYKP